MNNPDIPIKIERIYFVWNADFSLKGGIRALSDVLQQQHSCSLCEIAYHTITQKSGWKAYKKSLGVPCQEPCRNQLNRALVAAAGGKFPAVLAKTTDNAVVLLNNDDIDSCDGSLEKFKIKLDSKLAQYELTEN